MLVPHYAKAHDVPPKPCWSLISLFGGAILAVIVLMVGYVNADSKRRGMNSLLWTLLVIFIPKALGFLAVFPAAQTAADAVSEMRHRDGIGLPLLPKCGYAVTPICPHCGRAIKPRLHVLSYCGKPVPGWLPACRWAQR